MQDFTTIHSISWSYHVMSIELPHIATDCHKFQTFPTWFLVKIGGIGWFSILLPQMTTWWWGWCSSYFLRLSGRNITWEGSLIILKDSKKWCFRRDQSVVDMMFENHHSSVSPGIFHSGQLVSTWNPRWHTLATHWALSSGPGKSAGACQGWPCWLIGSGG